MHTQDVRGQPWSPCPHCPHATPGECPSRMHRRYCDLADPAHPESARYRRTIAELPAEDSPARRVDFTAEDPPAAWTATLPVRPSGASPPALLSSPTPAPLPPRIAAGWPAKVRACPHRDPIDRPSTCGCQEPAKCRLGKTDPGRDFVTIDRTCRDCVRAGGPLPPVP